MAPPKQAFMCFYSESDIYPLVPPILHQGGGARHHRKGDWTLGANPSAGDLQSRGVHVATQGRG